MFKSLLEVPSYSGQEGHMVEFLTGHIKARGVARCGRAVVDEHNNVYVIKGNAPYFPCLSAHIDTVFPIDGDVRVVEEAGTLVGYDRCSHRAGIGGDDKAGIMVCLEALERLENVAVCFFASEENGCVGAFASDPDFFDNIGYLLEWDCPGSDLCSYSTSGTRLFHNDGQFIKRALPSLTKRRMLWQEHPYTDVMAIRQMYPISCLNLSCGYYNWHRNSEYIRISETQGAVEMALELVKALGTERYTFPVRHQDAHSRPLVEVGHLSVHDRVLLEKAA